MYLSLAIIEEEGQFCGVRGVDKDSCPYRRVDRRAAWLRGWENGYQQKLADEASTPLTPEERAEGKARCLELVAMLKGEVHV